MTHKISKKKLVAAVYSTLFIIILSLLLFNDYGLIKYFSLKNEISQIDHEIQKIDTKLDSLTIEIDSLKTSERKIEKLARERYNMLRKGEKAFKIEEYEEE